MEFSDYLAVQNLVYSYPYLLDAGDFDGVGQLFKHATVYSAGIILADKDPVAFAKSFSDWVVTSPDGTPRTRHYISNLIIEQTAPGCALARSYVTVLQQTDTLPLQPVIGGDYRDSLEKHDGKWRFVERHMGNNLIGTLTSHGRYLDVIVNARANTDFTLAE